MRGGNRFRLEVLSRPENVGLVRIAVSVLAAGAPFSVPELEEIKVAVSEAVTNAIVHGYQGDESGWVAVEATLDEAWLVVSVADQGQGMEDVQLAREAAGSLADEHLGLGLLFMETFMDEVHIDSAVGAGTRVTMQRRVPNQPIPSLTVDGA